MRSPARKSAYTPPSQPECGRADDSIPKYHISLAQFSLAISPISRQQPFPYTPPFTQRKELTKYLQHKVRPPKYTAHPDSREGQDRFYRASLEYRTFACRGRLEEWRRDPCRRTLRRGRDAMLGCGNGRRWRRRRSRDRGCISGFVLTTSYCFQSLGWSLGTNRKKEVEDLPSTNTTPANEDSSRIHNRY